MAAQVEAYARLARAWQCDLPSRRLERGDRGRLLDQTWSCCWAACKLAGGWGSCDAR